VHVIPSPLNPGRHSQVKLR